MAVGGKCSFTGKWCSDLGTTYCTDSCPNNPNNSDEEICSYTGKSCRDSGTAYCTDRCPNNPKVTDV